MQSPRLVSGAARTWLRAGSLISSVGDTGRALTRGRGASVGVGTDRGVPGGEGGHFPPLPVLSTCPPTPSCTPCSTVSFPPFTWIFPKCSSSHTVPKTCENSRVSLPLEANKQGAETTQLRPASASLRSSPRATFQKDRPARPSHGLSLLHPSASCDPAPTSFHCSLVSAGTSPSPSPTPSLLRGDLGGAGP